VAFPYDFEANFEQGTNAEFDTESDTSSLLDFPHYSELAKTPGKAAPFRGAYCMRTVLAAGTTAAYLQENDNFDISADGTLYVRFYFRVSSDITMANNDEFGIFQIWSGTNTVEGGVYVNYTTANGLRVGIGETSASSFKQLTTDEWHCMEVFINLDDGVSDDGTLDAWLDNSSFTQVTSLDQGAITSAVFGILGPDAASTVGTVLMDQIVADSARIYPISNRWQQEVFLTKSSHVFVGNGMIDNVELIDGGSGDVTLDLFDTDIGAANDISNSKIQLKVVTADDFVDPAGMPATFTRGCYVSMGGTSPRAIVKIRNATGWGSEGAVRNVGMHRKPHPLGA